VVRGLQDVDDRPVTAVECLGLLAEKGEAHMVVGAGALVVLSDLLNVSLAAGDDAMLQAVLLALGRIASSCPLEENQQQGGGRAWGEGLMRDVLKALMLGGGARSLALRPAVVTLLWLARQGQTTLSKPLESAQGREALQAVLLEGLWLHEGDELGEGGLLHSAGQLLLLLLLLQRDGLGLGTSLAQLGGICSGLRGPAAAAAAVAGPGPTWESALGIVAGVALVPDGRKAVMGATGVVDVLLGMLELGEEGEEDEEEHGEAFFDALRLSLRALERLAVDVRVGRELLQKGAMDRAMDVLRRSPGPPECWAAATSLVARLTRVSQWLAGCQHGLPSGKFAHSAAAVQVMISRRGSSEEAFGRRASFGYSEAKLEALRCAMSAFTRAPNNALLLSGLIDLALANLRRPDGHQHQQLLHADEKGQALRQASLEALTAVLDMTLPKAQAALVRGKLWAAEGALAVAGCLWADQHDGLGQGACQVLLRSATLGVSSARELAFLLHYSEAGEELVEALRAVERPTEDTEVLLELLRPMLDLKPQPQPVARLPQPPEPQPDRPPSPPPPLPEPAVTLAGDNEAEAQGGEDKERQGDADEPGHLYRLSGSSSDGGKPRLVHDTRMAAEAL
jgi:hypothetical protein